MSVKMAGGFCTCCCGGEGMFNTVMTGPGLVYVQSMSFAKFKRALQLTVQNNAGGNAGAMGGAPPEAETMAR